MPADDNYKLAATIEAVQKIISVAVTATVFLSASGFIVFRAFISKYDVNPTTAPSAEVYLSAGFLTLFVYSISLIIGWGFGTFIGKVFAPLLTHISNRLQIVAIIAILGIYLLLVRVILDVSTFYVVLILLGTVFAGEILFAVIFTLP